MPSQHSSEERFIAAIDFSPLMQYVTEISERTRRIRTLRNLFRYNSDLLTRNGPEEAWAGTISGGFSHTQSLFIGKI